jgi:hypothetical protein
MKLIKLYNTLKSKLQQYSNNFSIGLNKTAPKNGIVIGYGLYGWGICIFVLFTFVQSACKKTETDVKVPVPTIVSINKAILNIGDTLIIKGSNFNTTPEKNLVSVASVAYKVIAASDVQLSAIVPKGAQSGQLAVGFSEGASTTFAQVITIVGSTQPFIKSISPASGAYENDTVVIKGGNFATPYTSNAVTFNGTSGRVINVSDSVIRVIVPNGSQTGQVLITTNGLNSLPQQYTILRVDPFADGHIYWAYSIKNTSVYPNYISDVIFSKGNSNTATPQSSTVYDAVYNANSSIFPGDPNPYDGYAFYPEFHNNLDNYLVVNDSQNNGYYLTASAFPFPATYNLMKFNASGSSAPVSVWSQTFPAPGRYDEYYANPADTIDYPPLPIHYSPAENMSIDGNIVYMKMGITDDYLTGDLSAANPTLTIKKNVFGDPLAYRQLFGTNYIFYYELGGSYTGDPDPENIIQIRYMPRGSKTGMAVPLVLNAQNSEQIMATMADPAHGDNLLIITSSTTPGQLVYNTIYKFNAATKQLITLYNTNNWRDASNNMPYTYTSGNTAFFWLGTHIYYANISHSTVGVGGGYLFTGLYRLNDNGVTPKVYTVYGKMESASNPGAANSFSFFQGK